MGAGPARERERSSHRPRAHTHHLSGTGANTSFDALGLAVPLITLPSPLLRGNFTSGLYR